MTQRWTETQAKAAVRVRDVGVTHVARWACPCGHVDDVTGPLVDSDGRQLRDRGEAQAVAHIDACIGW